MDHNYWSITGRLTREPKEISKPGAERKAVVLSVATNYREKVNGQWQQKALYVDAMVFGNVADNCLNYLSTGSRILVSGRANYRLWEGDGKTRVTMTIAANEVVFLDSKTKSEEPDLPF